METYPFRIEGTDKVVQVNWETMMSADFTGRVTLPDGSKARRARELEPKIEKAAHVPMRTDVVSDALGFTSTCLPDMREHLQRERIRGIEFVPDPQVKGFFQVHCSSEKAKLAYAKSRGMVDRNSINGSGSVIGPSDIEAAKELVSRKVLH